MDAAVAWRDWGGDLSIEGFDLATDNGLYTAIVLSLFLDRRAKDDDVLPDGSTDRRGWWGDAWPQIDRDQVGSRLWLLSREKQLPETLARAEEYAREALTWLIEDGVATRLQVTGTWLRMGVLGLEITITRPSGEVAAYRFETLWEALDAV